MQFIYPYLREPKISRYELLHKARYLQVALVVCGIATVLFGLINLPTGAVTLALLFFFIGGFCLVGTYLNYRGYYYLTAVLFSGLIFIAMIYNIIDGAALHDPGIAAFPIYIILVSFLFGKNSTLPITLISIVSIYGVVILDEWGWIALNRESSYSRALILSILVTVSAGLYWTINDSWEKSVAELQASYELTIKGWSKVLELRDFETKGHSDRVVEISEMIALEMNFTPSEVEQLRYAAYLHDIGKMAIPDNILFKSGPLSGDEWVKMKMHPTLGKEMLESISYLQGILPTIISHHEWWNGEGYPAGLAGKNIPLGARIFSVADVWDALNSDRPYRDAWKREDILAYIKKNRGTQFDPAIVDIFLSLYEQSKI